jgi:hypothetical protein
VPLTMQASDLVCSGSVMQTVFHLLLDGIEDEAPEPGLLLLGPAENAGDLNGSDSDATAVSSSGNSDSVFGRTAPPDSCTITKTETKTRTKKPKAKESSTRTSMGGLVGKLRKRLSRKHTSSVPKTSSFVLVEQSGCACSASKDNDKPCEVHQVLARHYEVVTGAFYQFDTRLPPPALQPPVAAKNAPECALPTKTSTQTRPARTSRGIRRVCGMVIPSLTQGPGRPTEKEV